MITNESLAELIRAEIPDARVDAFDYSGTMDHFNLTVRSQAFAGRTLIEQHQLVYAALTDALKDGRVHAVQIKTIAE
jgi:stress-induced morphogen